MMSERTMSMSLPLDRDGFLRRECPNCQRQFKWWPAPQGEQSDAPVAEVATAASPAREAPEAYYCPYCHEPAKPDAWWTKAQVEYARQTAMAEVMGPELRRFERNVQGLNRP